MGQSLNPTCCTPPRTASTPTDPVVLGAVDGAAPFLAQFHVPLAGVAGGAEAWVTGAEVPWLLENGGITRS